MPLSRARVRLDEIYPTLVRYAGLGIMVYATVVDQLERPSLIVAAAGMILFKTVKGTNGNGNGHGSSGVTKDDGLDGDRWSHLP